MPDFLFRGKLAELDPDVYELTQLESERQARKLILIASESTSPLAVREALASSFQNLYAEGYPDEDTRWMSEDEILDYSRRLAHYRRAGDPRYYKGVEYADLVEALARRRCAEAFAANGFSADQIYVNVQGLSGAPANNAVYQGLINLGDTVLGLNLLHGGHLSHGSSVNRSGKWFNAVHYTVDENECLNYDRIREQALETKPKLIIAGYSSYSWVPDWKKFRQIADEVGAYLLADISHIGGMVAAGVVPSPVGIAHVVMSTTHKSLDGPRGAVLLTTDPAIAKKIDKARKPAHAAAEEREALRRFQEEVAEYAGLHARLVARLGTPETVAAQRALAHALAASRAKARPGGREVRPIKVPEDEPARIPSSGCSAL